MYMSEIPLPSIPSLIVRIAVATQSNPHFLTQGSIAAGESDAEDGFCDGGSDAGRPHDVRAAAGVRWRSVGSRNLLRGRVG